MLEKRFSSIKEMQAQLFDVLVIAASVANMFGVLLNLFLQGYALPTQICVFCGVAILILGFWGTRTTHKDWATVGILITVVWIEFPFLYGVYRNIILVYFVLSILGITIFFPYKFSAPFCVMTIIWDVLVIIFMHYHPGDTKKINDTYLLLFTICSYLIVAIAVFALLSILIIRYEKQKEELYDVNEKLDYLATHDSLTALYNRGYLMQEIEKRMKADNASFIAIIMDVDNFKSINDTYGHSFGDKVLTVFAQYMKKQVEGKGFAARFGGEEFMIIYDHDDQESAMQDLRHLATQLEEHFQKEKQISITFSGGLELYSSQKKLDELIINADNKLYQAKQNGKNRVIC